MKELDVLTSQFFDKIQTGIDFECVGNENAAGMQFAGGCSPQCTGLRHFGLLHGMGQFGFNMINIGHTVHICNKRCYAADKVGMPGKT